MVGAANISRMTGKTNVVCDDAGWSPRHAGDGWRLELEKGNFINLRNE
jgi:hypothetical protein